MIQDLCHQTGKCMTIVTRILTLVFAIIYLKLFHIHPENTFVLVGAVKLLQKYSGSFFQLALVLNT